MTGQQWEQFFCPVIVDPGACAFVMPKAWRGYVPPKVAPHPKAGESLRAAKGQTIYSHGEKVIFMMTKGGAMADMEFIACDVGKALGSVSQMRRTGHNVAFNPPWAPAGPFIQHMDTGEKCWLEGRNALY